ncbi:MAG: peptidase domain-containing ABC transporter [Acidobacteriota bacterium]|jgi:putative ABC transport system ATP-binding protein
MAQANTHAAAHEHPSPLSRLRGWMAFERTDIWVVVIYSVAIGLLSLVVPIATQSLVNTIAFGTLLQPLVVLSLLVLLGLTFAAVLKVLRSHVVEVMQRRIFVRVSNDTIERLLRVRIQAFDDDHGPELVNRFFEVVTLQKGGATLLVDGLEVIMTTLIGMILLGVYHPVLLIFSVVMTVSIIVVLFPLGYGAIRTAISESKSKYALAAWLQELARHPATFKSLPGASFALKRSDAIIADYIQHRRAHWRVLVRQIIGSHAMQAIGTAAVLGAGGWLVMQRQLTLGQLVAAELVVAASLGSFSKFGKQLETFYDLLAAVDKLGYLTDLPMEESGSEQTNQGQAAAIEFRSVSFAHHPGHPLLEDLDLTIPAGSRLAITGGLGSGKSTLIDLIYGLREPSQGTLLFEGSDYRKLKLYDLRGQIALVRGIEIFHGTIEDNIRLGIAELSSHDLRHILETIGLLETVESLPEGLQTMLTTGGQPLTQGQSYRLMLARAMALRPRVLILDEILDRMEDSPEQNALMQRLTAPENPWTLIVSSRSQFVLKHCQNHIQLVHGQIRGQEKH